MSRPSPAANPSPSNNPTGETPRPTSPVKWERLANPVPDATAASPSLSPSTDPPLTFSNSTAPIASSDPDVSNFDFAGSLLGDSLSTGHIPTSGPAAQARSSLAGSILHGSAPPATTPGAPGTTTPTTVPASPPPASGAATAFAAAVGQSLGDGIRPMTMPPASTRTLRPAGGHTLGSISPDTGSGGNGPPNGTPPTLTSGTFAIQETARGKYQATLTIPISAVVSLTASLDGTTSWAWTNSVTSYAGYFSEPAGQNQFPASQAPVAAPITNTNTYRCIVGPTANQQYTIQCTATYPNGEGTATLVFTSSASPTGSISATKPLGSQTWSYVPGDDGGISVMLKPRFYLNFTATNNTNTSGQFALLQIVTYTKKTYQDSGGNNMFVQNNIDYSQNTPPGPNFNGNLIDNGQFGFWDYQFNYNGSGDDSYPASAGQTIPATGVPNPTTNDGPSTTLPNTINGNTVTSISRSDKFSIYIMFKSDMQGSVWIAVSQLNWSWSVSVSQQGGAWPTPNPTPQPDPGGSNTPAGPNAFPTWVNAITAFNQYYAVVNGVPQHWRPGA